MLKIELLPHVEVSASLEEARLEVAYYPNNEAV